MPGDAMRAYEEHVAALETKDLDAVVAGYHDDAVLASNDGIGRGHAYIRSVFEAFFSVGTDIDPHTRVMEQDGVVYVTWTAGAGEHALAGADTFVVRDGLIAVHTGFIAGR